VHTHHEEHDMATKKSTTKLTPAQARTSAERAQARLDKALAAVTEARAARNAAMSAMKAAGASYAEVGEAVGISPMAARSAILG
jgi:hypothetical protein